MEKGIKKTVTESVLIAIFAAVTIGFFVPFEFYIANIDELLLPLKYVGTAIALTSVLIFAVTLLLDRLTTGRNSTAMQIINTLTLIALSSGAPDGRTIFDIGEDEERERYYSAADIYVTGNIKKEGALS